VGDSGAFHELAAMWHILSCYRGRAGRFEARCSRQMAMLAYRPPWGGL